ncbi:MAG: DUF2231 domain-containing protein [Gammaproteobacteria bacterium]
MIEIIPNWHPIFVHFTVALLSIGIAMYVLVLIMSASVWRSQWLIVGRWNLWLGTLFSLVTAFFGILAFNSVEHDTPSHVVMLEHRNLAIITIGMFLPLSIWSFLKSRKDQDVRGFFIAVLLIAGGMLVSTAWHGAELVYRHGLGVISLPDKANHDHTAGHDHEHGELNQNETADMSGENQMQSHEHEHPDEGGHSNEPAPSGQGENGSAVNDHHHDDGHDHEH